MLDFRSYHVLCYREGNILTLLYRFRVFGWSHRIHRLWVYRYDDRYQRKF
jgi:hypothetical protein